jgi:hypothetical protein
MRRAAEPRRRKLTPARRAPAGDRKPWHLNRVFRRCWSGWRMRWRMRVDARPRALRFDKLPKQPGRRQFLRWLRRFSSVGRDGRRPRSGSAERPLKGAPGLPAFSKTRGWSRLKIWKNSNGSPVAVRRARRRFAPPPASGPLERTEAPAICMARSAKPACSDSHSLVGIGGQRPQGVDADQRTDDDLIPRRTEFGAVKRQYERRNNQPYTEH